MIVYRGGDGRWRVECTAREMRVFEIGENQGLLLRHECRSPEDLDEWLRKFAGLELADLVPD